MRRPRPASIRFFAATSALATAIGLTAAPAASAAPASTSAPASGARVVSQHTITLLTGDVVLLERFANGKQSATVHPPADRTEVGYSTQQVGQDVYVVPNDAAPLIAAGTLSRDLFDVTKLVANGYDDAHASTTPMIVQYRPNRVRAQAAPALPGTSRGATLGSINATAIGENKRQSHAFWTSLRGGAPSVHRVWLDAKVKVDLHESVPLIGAPQAWAAGYTGTGVNVAVLDTGIDAAHPDFAGKIVAGQNFVPAGQPGGGDPNNVNDGFGHGTHVASIIAGTGAADNGYYTGVAPGAGLIIGKVLDDNGNGLDSWIIDGMEWATQEEHARIVSMSLGSNSASDGTDPMSQAVNDLTAQTGALFVIAAGNAGPSAQTVASPGAADAALTVGAVDKSDQLAGFSSRGPRLGDYAIKPEIAAPGVDIVAARAPGTPIGDLDPVDQYYTRLSGTSMATPHVAGAAAILAEEHPDWTAAQLKPALISTSKDDGYTVYQQGGGRIDVARAFSQQVYADPGTLNLGYFRFPHTSESPVTKPVTFRNNGSSDVTLSLSLNVTGEKNGAPPAGMFTVSQPSVTVPAGGSATVTVTIDPNAGQFDLYGGYLTGTAGNVVVHTSVGAYVEPEMYNLTVPAIAHDGRQAAGISQVELYNPSLPGVFQTKYYSGGATPTFRVAPGTYSLMGYIFTMDAPNLYALAVTVVGQPDLKVSHDMTVTLDARPAQKVVINTPKPSAPYDIQVGYFRSLAPGSSFSSSFSLSTPIDEVYAVPTDPVTDGQFEFYSKWTLIAPPIVMSVVKPQAVPLDPLFMINSAPVDGTFKQPLVYVGLGTPADYAGKDMHGKIALIRRGTYTFYSKIQNAEAAGAAAAIIYNNVPGLLFAQAGDPGTVTIPAFTINQDVGLSLVSQLQSGPLTVQYSGTAQSPYQYDLMLPNPGQIAADQTYDISSKNTAEIDAAYYADTPDQQGLDVDDALRPWTTFVFGVGRNLSHPMQRTEWVSADPDTSWWHLAWENYPFNGEFDGVPTSYQPLTKMSENWFDQAARPGMPDGLTGWEDSGAPAYRQGDQFTMYVFPYVDQAQHLGFGTGGDTADTKLYQGSQLLAESTYPIGTFPAVPGDTTYRMVYDEQRSAPWWTYSTDISTTWTFHSATVPSGRALLPLLQVDYRLGKLDLLNRAPGASAYTFTLAIGHQTGVSGPPISSASAWASFDDGATWSQIELSRLDDVRWLAVVPQPKSAPSSGAVSLRVAATDAGGNSIDQTVLRAYGLQPSG